jgi:hypothetical protein
MHFNHCHYVPCLRWKQGEYQALERLSDEAKLMITPLIEVPEQGYDFETGTVKKSIDQHLAPFAKRIEQKLHDEPCFIDLNLIEPRQRMVDGKHPVRFVFDQLRARACPAVPVTGLGRDVGYQQSVRQVVARDDLGLCLRLTVEEAAQPNLKARMDAALNPVAPPEKCDLVLDLGAPNFEPLEGFARLVQSLITRLPHLNDWRTFTLLGTAFPESMAEIKSSPASIPRSEWRLYSVVARSLALARVRTPAFGDYGINHPKLLPVDMRKLKPSGTIRYTTETEWFIVKGPNVRDNRFDQFRGHCRSIIRSGIYSGREFSVGDDYIYGCAGGSESTGNLTTWRWVGTNHHLEFVARGIANFYGISGTRSPDGEVRLN